MNRIWICLLALALPVLFAACGGDDAQHEATGHAGGAAEHAHADTSGVDHGLTLNGDAKWEMDPHTRSMFAAMSESFADGEGEFDDAESARATGRTIRGQLDELIQGCTMEGEAHNQLHKFLLVYIPAVDGMVKHGTTEHAHRVGELLTVYPEYFE